MLTDDEQSPSKTTAGQQSDSSLPPVPIIPGRRGRPKGLGKVPGSGRQKGGMPWSTPEIRNQLINRSQAITTLADVCAGKPLLVGTERASSETGPGTPVWRYPTLNQRLRAVELIMAKVLPDLKASEVTVDATHHVDDDAPTDRRQVGRAILAILGHGLVAPGEGAPPKREGRHDPVGHALSPEKNPGDIIDVSTNGTGRNFLMPAPDAPQTTEPDYEIVSEETGAAIQLAEELRDGRRRWAIVDGTGRVIEAHHMSREAAEAQCKRLVERRII